MLDFDGGQPFANFANVDRHRNLDNINGVDFGSDISALLLHDHELGEALADAGPSLADMASAYRRYALAHPHLYVLMTQRPLPRDQLPDGLEEQAAVPLRAVLPDENQARAVWAAAHGLTILELNGRFPPGADLDAAWAATVAAFRPE